ncbi:hypothetical protein IAT38_004867 [Cryptococcus sp. DSM 104549]
MAPEERKKKRRQNVACDSCKLRRIKCDLLELLTALPSAESSATPRPSSTGTGSAGGDGSAGSGEAGNPAPAAEVPLAQLVQQNPDVSCTNCVNKELKCTTNQIVNPVRPKKGGRRIDEAKKLYGGGEGESDNGPGQVGQAGQLGQGGVGAGEGVQEMAQTGIQGTAGTGSGAEFGHGNLAGSMAMDWDAFNFLQQPRPAQQPPTFLQQPGQPLTNPNDIPDFSAFLTDPTPGDSSMGWFDPMLLQGATPLLQQPHPQASRHSVPPPGGSYDSNSLDIPTLFGNVGSPSSPQRTSPQPPNAPPTFSDAPRPPSSTSRDNPTPGIFLSGTHPDATSLPPTFAYSGDPIVPSPSSNPATNAAASIWWAFANNPHEAMAHVQRTGMTPTATPPAGRAGMLGEFQEEFAEKYRDAGLEGSGWAGGDAQEEGASRGEYHDLPGVWRPANPLYQQPPGPSSRAGSPYPPSSASPLFASSSNSRKRARQSSPSPSAYSSSGGPSGPGGGGKVVVTRSDPWGLWAPDEHDERMVRWGRREEVQERLADRALGLELSRHLVKVYLEAVHLSYPAISPESFYIEWIRAGQRSDRMTPAQEVLCAVMEAWGSRYSDSPIVLGLKPEKAKSAPKVIQADGTFIPGTQARAHWGRARLTVCNALVDRARRLIDTNGVLRKPSITGVQALTLYMQLLHMTDQKVDRADQWMEGHMVHSTILEQMKILGLMWESERPIITDDAELPMTMTQLKMKQRRLFWTHVIGDAFWAAASGQMPRMAQEEVDSAGEWLFTVKDRLPFSSFKALSFFLSCYYRIGQAGREIAIKLTSPGRKKGTLDIPEFCRTVRKLWGEIDAIARELNTETTEILNACDKDELLGFSPLNYLANLRLSGPFLLLLMHQCLREQLEFRKTLKTAYIVAASEGSSPESVGESTSSGSTGEGRAGGKGTGGSADKVWDAAHQHVDMLEALSRESVDVLLKTCRAQIGMFKTIIPTGIIQTASILLRVLVATAQLLAEVPCNEQGYPSDTPGGYGWTWETKRKEIEICTEALYQVGWAWADVAEVLDSIMVTMERLTPTLAELEAWKTRMAEKEARAQSDGLADIVDELLGTEIPVVRGDEREQATKRIVEEDNRRGEEVMEAVMKYWPPISVPRLIENSLQANPNALSSGVLRNVNMYHTITVEQATAARDAVIAAASASRESGDGKGPASIGGGPALGFGAGGALSGGLPGVPPAAASVAQGGSTLEGFINDRRAEAAAIWDNGQTIQVGGAGVQAGEYMRGETRVMLDEHGVERRVMMPVISSAVDASGAEIPLQTTSNGPQRWEQVARFADLRIGPLPVGTTTQSSSSTQTPSAVATEQFLAGGFSAPPPIPGGASSSTPATAPTPPPGIARARRAVNTVDPSLARAMGKAGADYVDIIDGDGGAGGGGMLGNIDGWYRPFPQAAGKGKVRGSEDISRTSGHTSSAGAKSPGAQLPSAFLQNINPETFGMGLFSGQGAQDALNGGAGAEQGAGLGSEEDMQKFFYEWAMGMGMDGKGDWTTWGGEGSAEGGASAGQQGQASG